MDGGNAARVTLGWLWFDDDPKTSLEQKVDLAAARYWQKFGRQPRLCYVSQRALGEQPPASGTLHVQAAANVLPGHFLFVLEETAA